MCIRQKAEAVRQARGTVADLVLEYQPMIREALAYYAERCRRRPTVTAPDATPYLDALRDLQDVVRAWRHASEALAAEQRAASALERS
jgi:hypothetical protein